VERCDVSFPSGNTHCAAWVYRPEESAGPVPCIVMSHGYSLTRHDGLASYAKRSSAPAQLYSSMTTDTLETQEGVHGNF